MRTVEVSSKDEMDERTLSYISVGYNVTASDDVSVTVTKRQKISGWVCLFWFCITGIGLLIYLLYGFFRKPQDVVRIFCACPYDADSTPVFEEEAPGSVSEDDADEQYLKALKLSILSGKASVNLIQQNFPVGYVKACQMVDWMEREGYVAPAQGQSPRKVLITLDEFEQKYGDV